MSLEDRRALIEQEESSPVSVRRQCELLLLSRSGFYYDPVPVSPEDQAVMNLIDEIYTKYPFYGSRRMSWELKSLGSFVGRKRAGRLMRLMGLEALFPKRNTSKPIKRIKRPARLRPTKDPSDLSSHDILRDP